MNKSKLETFVEHCARCAQISFPVHHNPLPELNKLAAKYGLDHLKVIYKDAGVPYTGVCSVIIVRYDKQSEVAPAEFHQGDLVPLSAIYAKQEVGDE